MGCLIVLLLFVLVAAGFKTAAGVIAMTVIALLILALLAGPALKRSN